MGAWKANAPLKREHGALEKDARSQARRSERSEFIASKWHREADNAANSQSELKGAMAAYRAVKEELADERELRQKADAECVKLRVDVAKL
eukprot:1976892-Pleurochrysis_carterae.AAC.1